MNAGDPAPSASGAVNGGARYARVVARLVDELAARQATEIALAGALLADAWASGGRLLVARTHHCLHEELVHRAAGPLAVAVLDDGDATAAECVASLGDASECDVILVHSNSGTTNKTVSIGLLARARGIATVALTQLSFERSDRVRSEHVSGLRLHEVCDVTVDLGGSVGDGALATADGTLICPTSGVLGACAAWMVVADASDAMRTAGRRPFFYTGVQLPGATEGNAELLARWERTGVAFDADGRLA